MELPNSRLVSINNSFNFKNLRVNRPPILTRKVKHTLSVRRPKSGEEFFRIRKGDDWKFPTCVYKSHKGKSDADNTYLVHPDYWDEFTGRGLLKYSIFHMGIIWDSDEIFLSDIPEPDEEGNDNNFHKTRRECYKIAEDKWITLFQNAESTGWDHEEALEDLGEPKWPSDPKAMLEAVELAFKDKFVNSDDHPALKHIRGNKL